MNAERREILTTFHFPSDFLQQSRRKDLLLNTGRNKAEVSADVGEFVKEVGYRMLKSGVVYTCFPHVVFYMAYSFSRGTEILVYFSY